MARHPLDPIEVQYGAVSRTRCLPNHAESLGGTDHIVSRRALLSLEHVSLPVWRRIRWRNLRLLRECLPSGKDKSLAITSSSHPLCPGNPMAVPQCDGACARCWCSCSPFIARLVRRVGGNFSMTVYVYVYVYVYVCICICICMCMCEAC